jgi:hypothetical protein
MPEKAVEKGQIAVAFLHPRKFATAITYDPLSCNGSSTPEDFSFEKPS